MGEAENKVQNEVSEYLTLLGFYFWRNNTGRRGKVSYGFKGSADFLGLLPSGRFLAVECKAPGKKQTTEQIEFQKNIETNKGLYILAYSVEDVKYGLQEGEDPQPTD